MERRWRRRGLESSAAESRALRNSDQRVSLREMERGRVWPLLIKEEIRSYVSSRVVGTWGVWRRGVTRVRKVSEEFIFGGVWTAPYQRWLRQVDLFRVGDERGRGNRIQGGRGGTIDGGTVSETRGIEGGRGRFKGTRRRAGNATTGPTGGKAIATTVKGHHGC